MQLLVQGSGDNRVFFVQIVLQDELADETGAGRYLTCSSCRQELQDMLVRLLVLLAVVLDEHEVADERDHAREVRGRLTFQDLDDVELLVLRLELVLLILGRLEIAESFKSCLQVGIRLEV